MGVLESGAIGRRDGRDGCGGRGSHEEALGLAKSSFGAGAHGMRVERWCGW